MFPLLARAGFAVVDILVRFFAFDLPFELPFLAMVFMVGRLTVLPFGDTVVFDWVVEVASVLVALVLPATVVELEVTRDIVGLVVTDWTIVEDVVVVSA